METIFHYYVEVRDEGGKHFQDSEGNKIKEDFKHQTHELSIEGVEKHCNSLFNSYNDTWRTNNINIDVRVFNEHIETYMLLYSFYGAEKRFVKHT